MLYLLFIHNIIKGKNSFRNHCSTDCDTEQSRWRNTKAHSVILFDWWFDSPHTAIKVSLVFGRYSKDKKIRSPAKIQFFGFCSLCEFQFFCTPLYPLFVCLVIRFPLISSVEYFGGVYEFRVFRTRELFFIGLPGIAYSMTSMQTARLLFYLLW